jgi:HlyD family secretion protein
MFKSFIFRWLLPLLAVLSLGLAARFIINGKPPTATVPPVQIPATAPATQKDNVAGSGVVQPSSELVNIASPLAATVKTVFVKAGDEVKQGQVLFLLDDREAQADMGARQAALNLADRNLQAARSETEERITSLKLYESIGDKRAMTEDELNRRQFAAQTAKAREQAIKASVAQAQAQLEQSKTNLTLRTVRAPFDATVLQVKVRQGEFAPATQLSEPLITLGNTTPLHVKIDIDEADIARALIKNGATVSARGSSSTTVKAQFVRVEPLVVPKRSLTNSTTERVDTRVLQVIYALPEGSSAFYVGQQVDAYLQAQETKN